MCSDPENLPAHAVRGGRKPEVSRSASQRLAHATDLRVRLCIALGGPGSGLAAVTEDHPVTEDPRVGVLPRVIRGRPVPIDPWVHRYCGRVVGLVLATRRESGWWG
jgi:hypothetical protein